MARDLTTAANENLRSAIGTLAEEARSGEFRQFGPLAVPSAGVPVPIFNRVFVFESPSPDELSAAVGWISERDVPFWVTVSDSVVEGVENHLADLDLVKAAEHPGMAMASLDEIPAPDSVVDIDGVTDSDDLDAFCAVAASVFEMPLDVTTRVYQAALAAGQRLLLGRVDGRPAACGHLIQSGDVAGVYTIGVVEEFRRRGIGEAMSREVLRAGRDAGCQVGVLQSSEVAYPLYEKMGFETVVTYHQFVPAV